jgi:hypothetical protein
LEEGRGEASDETVYKTVREDAGRYDTYEITSDICGIKEGEGWETEGCCGSGARREEH